MIIDKTILMFTHNTPKALDKWNVTLYVQGDDAKVIAQIEVNGLNYNKVNSIACYITDHFNCPYYSEDASGKVTYVSADFPSSLNPKSTLESIVKM